MNNEITIDEAMKWAVAIHRDGKLEEAEKIYRQILKSKPLHPDANHNIGVIALQVGKPKLGLPYLKEALNSSPIKRQYWVSYIKGLLANGELVEAEKVLQLSKKKGFSGLEFNELFERTRNEIKLNEHSILPALAFWNEGNAKEAIAWLINFLKQYPENEQALTQLGEFLRHQVGRLDESLLMLERSLKVRKDKYITWLSYGSALLQAKRKIEAKNAFCECLKINPNSYQAANDLAILLIEEGNINEAIILFDKAAQFSPNNPLVHMHLARALSTVKRFVESEAAARRALQVDLDNSSGAIMFLAALGVEPIPDRVPDGLLHALYDARAFTWDAGTQRGGLSYEGANLVSRALIEIKPPVLLDILDLGCGTGLVGILLRSHAQCLDGVDLSEPMLNKAREKDIYDSLFCEDMIAFLLKQHKKYDVVVSAATLIHFADLRSAFELISRSLRSKGVFIFTVFPNEKNHEEYAVDHTEGMAQGGCYVHGKDYISRLALEVGFKVEKIVTEIHEYNDAGQPRICLLVALSKLG